MNFRFEKRRTFTDRACEWVDGVGPSVCSVIKKKSEKFVGSPRKFDTSAIYFPSLRAAAVIQKHADGVRISRVFATRQRFPLRNRRRIEYFYLDNNRPPFTYPSWFLFIIRVPDGISRSARRCGRSLLPGTYTKAPTFVYRTPDYGY